LAGVWSARGSVGFERRAERLPTYESEHKKKTGRKKADTTQEKDRRKKADTSVGIQGRTRVLSKGT
jgi:hypothetical protein